MLNLKDSIKKVYRKFQSGWRKVKLLWSINWTKTLYFNFKMLPIYAAIKLPVYFWGPVKFTSLTGKIIINGPIKRNLVSFGLNLELVRSRIGTAEIIIEGTLLINGEFVTGNDYKIVVLKNATLEICEGSYLGSRTIIVASKKIILGKWFRLGYDSQILDSNFHFILNLEDNKVLQSNGEIIIGDYCWVGNRSSIMKATKTPKNSIIGSNSILNKDYTLIIPENSIIGGAPAKLIQINRARVFDPMIEGEIYRYFKENPEAEYFKLQNL